MKSLSITGAEFKVKDLRAVLEALPAVTNLDLFFSNFDMSCYKALTENLPWYRNMITQLNIKARHCVTTEAVQSIPWSFTNLVDFVADDLKVSKEILADERPWVCHGLNKLTLYFLTAVVPQRPSMLLMVALAVMPPAYPSSRPRPWSRIFRSLSSIVLRLSSNSSFSSLVGPRHV